MAAVASLALFSLGFFQLGSADTSEWTLTASIPARHGCGFDHSQRTLEEMFCWQSSPVAGHVTKKEALMPRDTREVLLLLANKGATRKRLERISEGYRVVSAFPPNLVVAEVAEPELQEMRRDPAVQFVVEGVVPDELLDELTDDEKLFVRGWLLKRTSPAKQRPGAGLAWDAPGFLPPDPPPGLK